MAAHKEIKCRITGKVQMVMFRDFIQRKARSFGIAGVAENKDDRSVNVIAQGSEEALNSFIEHLHKGPFLAKVARVDVEWREPTETFSGFKIVY